MSTGSTEPTLKCFLLMMQITGKSNLKRKKKINDL